MKKAEGVINTLNKIADGAGSEPEKPLYNRTVNQKIPLTILKGGVKYEVAIELEPLTDEEYFVLQETVQSNAKKLKNVSVDLFQPHADLARQKAVARYGYTENPNWKTATKDSDLISALTSYLQVSAKSEEIETSDLLDDESETSISLLPTFEGVEIETTLTFREATKAQMDEYLLITGNQPSKTALASNKKVSRERRLFALAEQLLVGGEGYSEGVPAWVMIEGAATHLNNELARMGKF